MYIIRTGLRNIGPFKTVRAAKLWLGKYDAKLAPSETIYECIDPEIALWAVGELSGTTTTGISENGTKTTEQPSPSSSTTSNGKPSKT